MSVGVDSIARMFDFRGDAVADQAGLVARIGELERSKSAAAAEQARLSVELDSARRAAEAARGVPAAKRGKGLGSEIALARLASPNQGGRHLGFARALVNEMPHTLAALEAGVLTEWRATLIVRESACLSVEDRATVDEELCADQSALEGKGDKRIEADAKAIAYRLDAQAVVDRAVIAASQRRVTVRPAPDNMAHVSVLLPMPQGVAVYATLKAAADTSGDDRTRGQSPQAGCPRWPDRHPLRAGHRPPRRSPGTGRGEPGHLR
jgi:hypothetical protein